MRGSHRGYVVLVALAACSRGGTEREPPRAARDAAASGDALPGPVVRHAVCQAPDDCALLCFGADTDCCGDACGCQHPVLAAEARALTEAHEAACAGKQLDCPKERCEVTRWWPACVDGACRAVPAAEAGPCTADADCELSTAVEGSCCGGCEPRGWHTRDLAAYHAWSKSYCGQASCPQRSCPYRGRKVARCQGGRCIAVTAPAVDGGMP